MRKSLVVSCWLLVVWLLGFGFWSFPDEVGAMGGPAPQKPGAQPSVSPGKVFLIDDFESGDLKSPREWWTFDIAKAAAVSSANLRAGEKLDVGNYSLLLSGAAQNWYAGGCGTYLAKEGQDLSKYANFSVDLYGFGAGSGTLKAELYDDDNKNWQVEQDPARSYSPIYDDKFTYEIRVDWIGWKKG